MNLRFKIKKPVYNRLFYLYPLMITQQQQLLLLYLGGQQAQPMP